VAIRTNNRTYVVLSHRDADAVQHSGEWGASVVSVPGVIAILVVLALLPVVVLMSGGVASGIIGFFLGRDADRRNEGSELLEPED
jgi:hypothetical protein